MPSEYWGKQREWPPASTGKKKEKVAEAPSTPLEEMSMPELRAFAKSKGLKAKDNDKVTLLKEILEELKNGESVL